MYFTRPIWYPSQHASQAALLIYIPTSQIIYIFRNYSQIKRFKSCRHWLMNFLVESQPKFWGREGLLLPRPDRVICFKAHWTIYLEYRPLSSVLAREAPSPDPTISRFYSYFDMILHLLQLISEINVTASNLRPFDVR